MTHPHTTGTSNPGPKGKVVSQMTLYGPIEKPTPTYTPLPLGSLKIRTIYGHKHYYALTSFRRRARMSRKRFKRASDAIVYGRRLVARCARLVKETQ